MSKLSAHLVPPQKLVAVPILDTIPYVQKLSDAMIAYMLCEMLCLVPVERSSKRKEAHD